MRKFFPLIAVPLMALAFACPAQSPQAAATAPAPAQSVPAPASTSSAGQVDIDDIRTFTRVYSVVKQAYVDPVSDKRLMQAAIHGLLSKLDPHSAFLDRRDLRQLSEDTSGEYAGIGIQVAAVGGQLRVIAPLDGTPAARAGIRSGDVILSINGKAITSQSIDSMVDHLRGPAGSQVTLSILHDKASVPKLIKLTRERIQVASVRSRMLEPGFALLRISEFQQATEQDLRQAITRLEKGGALKGAVLDLRSNPGGLLTAAVGVSDIFLERGAIVSTRGRTAQSDMRFDATQGDMLHGAPLVVLVDQGTASAAEIVAGALKDNHRGLIMGQRTFGKGSVQSVLPLDDNYAVKLTTARYYTPSGTSIQAEGITPDIALGDLTVNPRETPPTPIISEADLPHHLENGSEMQVQPAQPAKGEEQLALDDYALSEALNVLKGMALSRQQNRSADAKAEPKQR
ncbi:MAG: S41 family peptidase [Rhodanobacteraceae bacterium]